MKKMFKMIGYILLIIYGLGVMIFGAYFQWQFAAENGFVTWLLLGWIVPMLKAIIWPIYLIF